MDKYAIAGLIWETHLGDMSVAKCADIISKNYEELEDNLEYKNGEEVMVINNHHALPFVDGTYVGKYKNFHVVYSSTEGLGMFVDQCIEKYDENPWSEESLKRRNK